MYCSHCGKHNPEESKFCQHCGEKFDGQLSDIDEHGSVEHKPSSEFISQQTSPYPYVISLWKLLILSTVTFGLFDIYWFYRQWKSFYAVKNQKHGWFYISFISLFAGFSSFSLFKIIAKEVKEIDPRKNLEATALSILFLVLNVLYKLPSPYWLLTFLSVFALLPVQKTINHYWTKRYGDKVVRSGFGVWNFIVAFIGLIVLLLALYGTFSNSSNTSSNTYSQNNSTTLSSVSTTPAYVDNQTLMQTNPQAVVNILCDNQNGGSGTVWVKDGLIVTNNHVISGSTSCLVTIPDTTTGEPVQIYQAKPLIAPYLSQQYDIAILSVYAAYRDTKGKVWGTYPISLHAFVPPSNCTAPQLGDSVRIYGYPVTSGGYNLTITDGIVSSFADNGNILTSAKIDSGNSGGLAIDKNGCMLGIPSAVLTGNYQNLGVIIPDNVIKDFITKASTQDTNTQAPTDTPVYTAPQSYQQTGNGSDNPPAGGYQNYGWYMHNGHSMQYVDGNWYSTPQQDVSPTPTQNWWGY